MSWWLKVVLCVCIQYMGLEMTSKIITVAGKWITVTFYLNKWRLYEVRLLPIIGMAQLVRTEGFL